MEIDEMNFRDCRTVEDYTLRYYLYQYPEDFKKLLLEEIEIIRSVKVVDNG